VTSNLGYNLQQQSFAGKCQLPHKSTSVPMRHFLLYRFTVIKTKLYRRTSSYALLICYLALLVMRAKYS